MAQPVYFKYGDTATINGETIQTGKILLDYEAKKISLDKDGTNRVLLSQPVDTALSTTSTNAIANSTVTNEIFALNDNGIITGLTFDGTYFYATGKLEGADAVTKKLGNQLHVAFATGVNTPTNATTNTLQFLDDEYFSFTAGNLVLKKACNIKVWVYGGAFASSANPLTAIWKNNVNIASGDAVSQYWTGSVAIGDRFHGSAWNSYQYSSAYVCIVIQVV